MFPDDAFDPAVNSSQEDELDETPYPWDCDRDFPEEGEEEDDE